MAFINGWKRKASLSALTFTLYFIFVLFDRSGKGFKSEWATVKDEVLHVGSMGKEWTTASGEFENHDPQYVKCINTKGLVSRMLARASCHTANSLWFAMTLIYLASNLQITP